MAGKSSSASVIEFGPTGPPEATENLAQEMAKIIHELEKNQALAKRVRDFSDKLKVYASGSAPRRTVHAKKK